MLLSTVPAGEFNIGPFVLLGMILAAIAALVIYNALSGKKSRVHDQAPAAPVTPAEPAPAAPDAPAAPGSAGAVKLYDTPPKTAAMLMAIVAEKTGKPLNELRFLSIRQIK